VSPTKSNTSSELVKKKKLTNIDLVFNVTIFIIDSTTNAIGHVY
jgi:hypothetical protein